MTTIEPLANFRYTDVRAPELSFMDIVGLDKPEYSCTGNEEEEEERNEEEEERNEDEEERNEEEEQISRLHFERGDHSKSLDTCLFLRTARNTHVFEWDDAAGVQSFGKELLIRPGDRLVGVNNVNVEGWRHSVVVASLNHMMGDTEIFILIGRDVSDGMDPQILVIKVTLELVSRGSYMDLIRSVEIVRGELLPAITCFVYKGAQLCRIKQTYYNLYLKCSKKGFVKMKAMKNGKSKKFQFIQHTFAGVRSRNRHPQLVYVCVFESARSDFKGHCICQLNKKKVGLVPDSIEKYFTVKKMTKADSRFFSVHETLQNEFCIQSIVNKGYFLTCSPNHPKLSVTECQTALTFPGTFPDASFSIVYDIQ